MCVKALSPGGARFTSPLHPPPADLLQACVNLEKLTSALEDTFRIDLGGVDFDSMGAVKQFCSGLLDPSSRQNHPWWPVVRNLSIRTRVSVSGTVFLFRKTLPGSVPSLGEYVNLLSHEAPAPPPGYLRFIGETVNSLFPVGWDRGYQSRVSNLTLSTSACDGNGRSKGGVRGLLFDPSTSSRMDKHQLRASASGVLDKVHISKKVAVKQIVTDGKVRTVTISSSDMAVLSPLHQLLYDRISKEKWLLRGEAKPSCFAEFQKKEGEVFVSGDYESATDNLNLDVARHILERILSRCKYVPLEVRIAAVDSLTKELWLGGKCYEHRRGQLMGSLLCFPLLCLQNFLAFKFYVRRQVPVRINGDDIVFRCTVREYRTWMDGVIQCGLRPSLGKTAVALSWFSLNSTFFEANRDRKPSLIPIARSTQWFKRLEDPNALAGRYGAFAKGMPKRKLWLVALLKQHSSAIWATQRSVRRGLGVGVSRDVLIAAGLWDREVQYLAVPTEPPLPVERSVFHQNVIPEGWYREHVKGPLDEGSIALERLFFEEMVALTWERRPIPPKEVTKELWGACRAGTVDLKAYWSSRERWRRMLRVSVRQMKRQARPPAGTVKRLFGRREKLVPVWRPPWFGEGVGRGGRVPSKSFFDVPPDFGICLDGSMLNRMPPPADYQVEDIFDGFRGV